MPDVAILIVEPSEAMRELMRRTLVSAGCADGTVSEAGSAPDLVTSLGGAELLSRQKLIVIVGATLVVPCASVLRHAARAREQLSLPALKLVILYEWGTLETFGLPTLGACETIAVLEKPFPLHELEKVAKLACVAQEASKLRPTAFS